MPLRVRFFFIFLFSSFVISLPVFFAHAKESFPFVGQLVSKDVNIRAGGNTNFEKLCQLHLDQNVIVLGKEFSWYKVRLPKGVSVFISDKYVEQLSDLKGKVTANDVNLRARANTESTIIGQLKIGSEVSILEKLNGWYKIVPPSEVYGWVSAELVKFKTADLSKYQEPESVIKGDPLRVVVAQSPVKEQKLVLISGVLERSDIEDGQVTYRVLQDGKPVYYLQGLRSQCDSFLNANVSVEGYPSDGDDNKYSSPALTILKIQLML